MKFSRLSKYKIRKILEVFCNDLNASVAAQILGINRNTVNRYYNLFREAIFLTFPIFVIFLGWVRKFDLAAENTRKHCNDRYEVI